jgi:WD40 repeat protein
MFKIASGARDWKIKLWSVVSEKEMKTFSGHSDWVMSLVLLSNGHLTSASSDRTIRLWNLDKEPSLVKTLFAHSDTVFCLVLLNDEQMMASGSRDGGIKIWHFERNSTDYSGDLN